MKKIILTTACFIIISLLSSCLYTLHPIFTEKDLVLDTRLWGKWVKDKDGSSDIYEKASPNDLSDFSSSLKKNAEKIYVITHYGADGKMNERSLGFLVKLGDSYFMDIYPGETEETKDIDDFFKLHFIKLHSIYKIQFQSNNSFELKQFDEGFLKNLVENKQFRIKHEIMDDGSYLITASTSELQQYILKYSNVSEAYYKDGISVYNKTK